MQKDTIWKEYVEKTEDKPPRPLLVEALRYVDEKENALDLGAGALNDSKHLIEIGFKNVVAVDMDNASSEKAKEISFGGFSFVQSRYVDFAFPEEKYDLVNAQYALPFNPPDTFNEVLEKIIQSLKKGGVFVGQFFGDRDSWNVRESGKTFHTLDEAKKMLSNLRMVEFREEEMDGKTARGTPKHWHVFHFIAIK